MNLQDAPKASEASEQGYTFEPRYPSSNAGIEATITVRGPESEVVRTMLRRQIAELQTREQNAKKRGRDAEPPTLEELETQSIELAVAYTKTWAGFKDGDRVLEPTEANYRRIYAEHPWIRRQVIEEAQDLGNFVRPAPKLLSPTPAPSSRLT